MLTVACVLRSGGRYTPVWAARLRNGVARHLAIPHRFVCLTDTRKEVEAEGIEAIRLTGGKPGKEYRRPDAGIVSPGWWAKIELFRPDIFAGPVLYFDLDTVIVGPLDGIAAWPHDFTMCHEFYRPALKCSTAMAWSGDRSAIWRAFAADPAGIAARYDSLPDGRIGDQAFIEDAAKAAGWHVNTFRDLFGETSIASYKVHCRAIGRLPEGASAVAFHGAGKQDELADKVKWIGENWK